MLVEQTTLIITSQQQLKLVASHATTQHIHGAM